jgi:hypothetical protein
MQGKYFSVFNWKYGELMMKYVTDDYSYIHDSNKYT